MIGQREHTGGTWAAGGWHGNNGIEVVAQDPADHGNLSQLVAVARRSEGIGFGECRANARLIAAAPELLAVARGCLGFLEWQAAQHADTAPDETWLAPLRAAIARAEGEN